MSQKEQPNYYAIIPATVRYDTNLKYTKKLLYGEIIALANKSGYCYAQNKYLVDLYNLIVNNSNKIPKKFLDIINRLEFIFLISCIKLDMDYLVHLVLFFYKF